MSGVDGWTRGGRLQVQWGGGVEGGGLFATCPAGVGGGLSRGFLMIDYIWTRGFLMMNYIWTWRYVAQTHNDVQGGLHNSYHVQLWTYL